MSRLPARLPSPAVQTGMWAVTASLAVAAATTTDAGAPVPTGAPTWLLLVVVAAATAWSELGYVALPGAPVRGSAPATAYTGVAQTIAVLVLPPVAALVAVIVGSLAGQMLDRRAPIKVAFNAGLHTTAAAAAVAVVHAGPVSDPTSMLAVLRWLAAALTYEAVTVFGVAAVVSAAQGLPLRSARRGFWTGVGANMALTALIGVLVQSSWLHVLLAVVPAVGVRSAYAKMSASESRARRADEERDRFAQTVAGVSDAVLLCRPDGTVELASPASEDLLAVATGHLDGALHFDAVAALRDGSGQPVTFADLLAVRPLEGSPAVVDLTLTPHHSGGRERAVRVSLTPQFDADGALTSAVVVVQDRTDDHELSELKDGFIAQVSHELRTPLTPIITYAQLLSRFHTEMDDAAVHTAATTIHSRGKHMLTLIEDLLAVSKIAAGEHRSELLEPVELAAAVSEVADDVGLQYPGHTVFVDVDEPVTLVANASHVRQIAANLISNACKYSPAGPVEVAICSTGGVVTVDVTDFGPGIAAADRDRIFTAFERLASAAATASGTGVGLHIARNLARSLGGDVTLHSSSSHGATFRWQTPQETV